MPLLSWLIGSAVGRAAGLALAACLVLGLAYNAGSRAARRACQEDALRAQIATLRDDAAKAEKARTAAESAARAIEVEANGLRNVVEEITAEAAKQPPAARCLAGDRARRLRDLK